MSNKQWGIAGIAIVFVFGSMVFLWRMYHGQSVPVAQEVSKVQKGTELVRSVREHFNFAPYVLDASVFIPSVPGEKASIEELQNLKNFENPKDPQKDFGTNTAPYQFSEENKKSLSEKNFFVTPVHDLAFDQDPEGESGRTDDWTQVYKQIGGFWGEFYRAPENTPFVTTDYALHVYHRLLEKEFEHAEQTVLYEHVRDISQKLFNQALTSASESTGYEKASYERLSGYFMVPLTLTESVQSEAKTELSVDTKVDTLESALQVLEKNRAVMNPEIAGQVEQELRSIFTASESMVVPPLYGKYIQAVNPSYFEDYTQYGPRSHYAKNSVLRSYFRSMMWFGRQNLLSASPDLMRDSLTIAKWMEEPSLKKEWEAIYIPTTFFVGESDDLGVYEYQDLMKQLGDKPSWTFDDIKQASELIKGYRGSAILSSVLVGDTVLGSTKEDLLASTRGFRFMGQRFTPDAFIFNQLTKGEEKGPKLPSTPTALMVMSVFGDTTSDPLVDDWITKNMPDGRTDIHAKMSELKSKFSALPEDTWTQNIYWGWTGTLRTLFQKTADLNGYPYFMKQSAWRLKNTNAALGSWTELKHDTLLYAKQSYAERGGGGDDPKVKPAVAKGYVEPNLAFWDRLFALSDMTYRGMNQLGLLDQEIQGRNEQFLGSLRFFRSIAQQEIENKVIADEDFERLRMEPGKLENVISVLSGEVGIEDTARSALIADVHTDVPGGQILYEANGKPNSIFVAVKDANGVRLTRGLVYNYYEFAGPLAHRLTDQSWRAAVYTGKDLSSDGEEKISFPSSPEWTNQMK